MRRRAIVDDCFAFMFPRGVGVCMCENSVLAPQLYRYVLADIVLLPPDSTGGLYGLTVWHGPALCP